MRLRYLIFDLDQTLYPPSTGLMQAIGQRISLYMAERLHFPPDQIDTLRRAYYRRYGTTSRGLMIHHTIDLDDYLHFVHDLPVEDYLSPNPALDAMLSRLPQEKPIFTNASTEHAQRVLHALGIAHHFNAIYDARFMQSIGPHGTNKPDPRAYRALLKQIAAPPSACLLIDDALRNLRPAQRLGIYTVLITPSPPPDHHGADAVITDILELEAIVNALTGEE